MKTLSNMNQSSGNTDPLAYMAQETKTSSHTSSQQYSPSQYVPPQPHYTPPAQQSPQSTNDVMLAMMNQIQGNARRRNRKRTHSGSKTKHYLWKLKKKGVVLDAEAEAFLADVQCTAHYDDSLAITTTTAFEVSHEDAYDFDVDEASHTAVAFMANLTGTSTGEGTSNDTDFHSEEEQLDSDVDSDIDDYDDIIPYHQYQSNTEVENVPTEVSPVLSDQISMITILDDMGLKQEGYMNTNKEQSLANDSLKAKLERYKTQVESNKSLKTKSEKVKTDNKAREDGYQEELVWLRYANKVVTELLQSYGQPVQTIPMLSKRPIFASKDLHKTALGRSNPKYLKTAQLSRPTLYIGDAVVNLHAPHRVHDNEDTLVYAEVSRTKMLKKMKDPKCPIISSPINYAKLNNLYDTFVPQKELTREQAYYLPANEVASNQSKPAQHTFKELYKSKAGSNSSVSSKATIPVKPKAVASGLYAMTPKYVSPQKRINRETNSSLPRKETVTVVDLSNVPVNLPTGIKSVPDAKKSKSKSDKKIHKNLPSRSKNVKRVAKPSRNLNKKNRVDSSLNDKRTGFISKSVSVCKTCNECLVFGNHDDYVVKSVNAKNPMS
nr:hypothetical protein [Tanacetum cinerariifolium]